MSATVMELRPGQQIQRMTINDYPEIMTVPDVKEYLRIGENKTYDLLNHPQCPTMRLGRALRIRKDKFVQFIDAWENGEVEFNEQ